MVKCCQEEAETLIRRDWNGPAKMMVCLVIPNKPLRNK